jgi:hypothetical protein
VEAAAGFVAADLRRIAADLPLDKAVHQLSAANMAEPDLLHVLSSDHPRVLVSFGTPTGRVGIVGTHGQGYKCCKCRTQTPCQHVNALLGWLQHHEDEVPIELDGMEVASNDGMGPAPADVDAQQQAGCPVTKLKVSFEHATLAAKQRSKGGVLLICACSEWLVHCDKR